MKEYFLSMILCRGIIGSGRQCAPLLCGSFYNINKRFPNYMTSIVSLIVASMNEHGNTDFAAPINMYVEPEDGYRYTKPLVLLTDRFCVSAAETFTLAMHTLDGMTQIGDTTFGAFADRIIRELPNGWGYSIGVGDWTM
jgi:C-terminal processing protease CtpA/Prc